MNRFSKTRHSVSIGTTTRNLGPLIKICRLNIENISIANCQISNKILTFNKIDVVRIQETHAENKTRGTIPEYDLIGATYHKFYGVATCGRKDIVNVTLVKTSVINDIHEVIFKVGDTTINNIYKRPATQWPQVVLQCLPHPAIYVGDFNSHHQRWKYKTADQNGEDLLNQTHLPRVRQRQKPLPFSCLANGKQPRLALY